MPHEALIMSLLLVLPRSLFKIHAKKSLSLFFIWLLGNKPYFNQAQFPTPMIIDGVGGDIKPSNVVLKTFQECTYYVYVWDIECL